jgi:hypothetical protein
MFTSVSRNLYSPSEVNGRGGTRDESNDWVMHGVELGIRVAASCGCCRIMGIIESGSGWASSRERDGNGAADGGRELMLLTDTFAGSSIQPSSSSRSVSLFSFSITRRRHSSGAVCL